MAANRRRVIWSPRGKRDLLDVWRYYRRVASGEVADKLLREISETAERLSEEALMWRTRDEIMPGLRSVRVQPYTIFYRVNDGLVQIIRVLHERRDFAAVLVGEGPRKR